MKTNVQPQMLQTGRSASDLASPGANWCAALHLTAISGTTVASLAGTGKHGNRRSAERNMRRSAHTSMTEFKRSTSNNRSKIVRGFMPQVAGG